MPIPEQLDHWLQVASCTTTSLARNHSPGGHEQGPKLSAALQNGTSQEWFHNHILSKLAALPSLEDVTNVLICIGPSSTSAPSLRQAIP